MKFFFSILLFLSCRHKNSEQVSQPSPANPTPYIQPIPKMQPIPDNHTRLHIQFSHSASPYAVSQQMKICTVTMLISDLAGHLLQIRTRHPNCISVYISKTESCQSLLSVSLLLPPFHMRSRYSAGVIPFFSLNTRLK